MDQDILWFYYWEGSKAAKAQRAGGTPYFINLPTDASYHAYLQGYHDVYDLARVRYQMVRHGYC